LIGAVKSIQALAEQLGKRFSQSQTRKSAQRRKKLAPSCPYPALFTIRP